MANDYVINWPKNPTLDDTVIYDDRLWTWDGDKWVLQGSSAFVPIKGDEGLKGEKGDKGDDGSAGPRGLQGNVGPQGPAGLGLNFLGSVETPGNLPTTGNEQNGDSYVVVYPNGDTTDNSQDPRVFSWGEESNGTQTWIDIGPIVGPQGVPGENGEDGKRGPQGPEGDVKMKETIGPPAKGARGLMYIDSNNVLYVTTGI